MKINSSRMWQLLIGILLVSTPFFSRIPFMVQVMVAVLTFWSIVAIRGYTSFPGSVFRFFLLALVIIILLTSFGTLLGRDAGTTFLILLSFMKLFEIKDKRDVFIVIYIGYFLIASNFFYTQDPWTGPYVLIAVIYLTSVMIAFSDRVLSSTFKQRMYIAERMILQAIPLMLILFVLFPRIPGPLWGLPKDATSATTGLSTDMSPGSMSNLIRSGEPAFRVRFRDKIPSHQDLYWRGPVLSHYDGQIWTAKLASVNALPKLVYPDNDGSSIKYTVTLEPHQRQWLFALEHPVGSSYAKYQLSPLGSSDATYRLSRELQLFNDKKITSVFQYSMVSNNQVLNKGLLAFERRNNLQLPVNYNRETVELGRQWRKESGGNSRYIAEAAMRYFNKEPFYYTLTPSLLGNDAMDDFLFETRRGFCEHYASAFVYLMRAAGIPARVVTGYQGGDINPVDDYLIVRQSNAHAWAEIWLDDTGWTRYDPTAAVSPARIEQGIQEAILEKDLLPSILFTDNAFLLKARYQWDSFNHKWTEWIIGFNQKKQRELFRNMGFKNVDWQDLITWLIVVMLAVGGVIAFWIFRQGSGRKTDIIRHSYDIFCKKLEKADLERRASEGPREFLERIKDRFPKIADSAEKVTQHYLAIRYGGDLSKRRTKLFINSVKAFSVKG